MFICTSPTKSPAPSYSLPLPPLMRTAEPYESARASVSSQTGLCV